MGGHLCPRHLNKLPTEEVVVKVAVGKYDEINIPHIVSRKIDGAQEFLLTVIIGQSLDITWHRDILPGVEEVFCQVCWQAGINEDQRLILDKVLVGWSRSYDIGTERGYLE